MNDPNSFTFTPGWNKAIWNKTSFKRCDTLACGEEGSSPQPSDHKAHIPLFSPSSSQTQSLLLQPKWATHSKSVHPLWRIYCKSFSWGVWFFNVLAYWASQCKSHTPSVCSILVKPTHKGYRNLTWKCPVGYSTWYSYTPRTLRACCSQFKFRILKIRQSIARALFLYNCTPNISRSADASVSVA